MSFGEANATETSSPSSSDRLQGETGNFFSESVAKCSSLFAKLRTLQGDSAGAVLTVLAKKSCPDPEGGYDRRTLYPYKLASLGLTFWVSLNVLT